MMIWISYKGEYFWKFIGKLKILGKARRLKQAKDEATEEIEKYRQDRDKQFKEFESKVIFVGISVYHSVIYEIFHILGIKIARLTKVNYFLYLSYTAYGLTWGCRIKNRCWH